MVVDNTILLNIVVSSENISESIKVKTENGFHLKANVCKFRRNKKRIEKQSHRRHLFISVYLEKVICLPIFSEASACKFRPSDGAF